MPDDAPHVAANPDRRLPRNVKLLGWASLLNDVASEMIFPLLPQFLIGVLGGNRIFSEFSTNNSAPYSPSAGAPPYRSSPLSCCWPCDKSQRENGTRRVVGRRTAEVLTTSPT